MAMENEVPSASDKKTEKLDIECIPASDIRFSGDFRTACVVDLTVRNNSKQPLLYKLKTTCPHRYVVRPHKGEIAPDGASVVISITLLPFHFREDNTYNDKFLLQVCALSKLNQDYSKHDFWSMVPKEELFQNRFRCIFDYNKSSTIDSYSSDTESVEPLTPNNITTASEEDILEKLLLSRDVFSVAR